MQGYYFHTWVPRNSGLDRDDAFLEALRVRLRALMAMQGWRITDGPVVRPGRPEDYGDVSEPHELMLLVVECTVREFDTLVDE